MKTGRGTMSAAMTISMTMTMTRAAGVLACGLMLSLTAGAALGQSLFQKPVEGPAESPAAPAGGGGGGGVNGGGTPGAAPPAPARRAEAGPLSLEQASLIVVVPPAPKTFVKHDKIEVIINESTVQRSEQSLETTKEYDLRAELLQFPSLRKLLEAELTNGITSPGASASVRSENEFTGDGTYERTDRITSRISGLVTDVKPNGLLLVEARETIISDEESKTLVIAGLADPKDVTAQGTVQSSQLANLVIRVEHAGQVKDASTKGLIPRVLDTLFNF